MQPDAENLQQGKSPNNANKPLATTQPLLNAQAGEGDSSFRQSSDQKDVVITSEVKSQRYIGFNEITIDIDGGGKLKTKTPEGSPQSFTPEQWTEWLTHTYEGFGNLENVSHLPEIQNLSPEARQRLTERLPILAGHIMSNFISGIVDEFNELKKRNSTLQPVGIVFTDLTDETIPHIAFYAIEMQVIIINTKYLEEWASVDPNTMFFLTAGIDEKISATLSASNLYYLLGREETNHAAYFSNHPVSNTNANSEKITLAEYDAQPHEFLALLMQRRYVKQHPDRFPNPPKGPGELEVLNERIQNAWRVLRAKKANAATK